MSKPIRTRVDYATTLTSWEVNALIDRLFYTMTQAERDAFCRDLPGVYNKICGCTVATTTRAYHADDCKYADGFGCTCQED